ncbi:MAG: biotin/lipoyl-containing protein [Acidobacteriota bacterium]
MKLHATIADYQTDVRVTDEGSRVSAEIDGRRYELDVHQSAAGSYLMIADGRVFDCRVQGRPESGKQIEVVVGTRQYAVTLTDPKRLRSAASMVGHGDDVARIVAPMPGKVVRVLVKVGEQVEAGAGIVVVEAMKMQNELKTPKAGQVTTLQAELGATVNSGDVLAVVE